MFAGVAERPPAGRRTGLLSTAAGRPRTTAKISASQSGSPDMPIDRKKPIRNTSLRDHREFDSSLARGWVESNRPMTRAPISPLSPISSKPTPPMTRLTSMPVSTSTSSWPTRSRILNRTGRSSGVAKIRSAQGPGSLPAKIASTTRAMMSWAIRIPIAVRPWKMPSSRLASSIFAARTVEEKASAMPTSSATIQSSVNNSHVIGVKIAIEKAKCRSAPPTTWGSPICLSLSLRPIVKSSIKTPSSARCSRIGPGIRGHAELGPKSIDHEAGRQEADERRQPDLPPPAIPKMNAALTAKTSNTESTPVRSRVSPRYGPPIELWHKVVSRTTCRLW